LWSRALKSAAIAEIAAGVAGEYDREGIPSSPIANEIHAMEVSSSCLCIIAAV
jgi:hypothetical protein